MTDHARPGALHARTGRRGSGPHSGASAGYDSASACVPPAAFSNFRIVCAPTPSPAPNSGGGEAEIENVYSGFRGRDFRHPLPCERSERTREGLAAILGVRSCLEANSRRQGEQIVEQQRRYRVIADVGQQIEGGDDQVALADGQPRHQRRRVVQPADE